MLGLSGVERILTMTSFDAILDYNRHLQLKYHARICTALDR